MDKEQGREPDGAPERAHNAGAGAPSCSNTIQTARSRTSGAYFADLCFVMMTPSSQDMEPPGNPARFIWKLDNLGRSLPHLIET